jgi:protein-S-isoprenylcysteine O-methyltransferase Ste14
MELNRYTRIFGIGPRGAIITLLFLAAALAAEHVFAVPPFARDGFMVGIAGAVLAVTGLCIHGWTMLALRNWWQEGKLCTAGPFRFVRHPMYAAWISVVSPGVALMLNSWTVLLIIPPVHVIWHLLVASEEDMMRARFGDEYRDYAARTGRFVPRIVSIGKQR